MDWNLWVHGVTLGMFFACGAGAMIWRMLGISCPEIPNDRTWEDFERTARINALASHPSSGLVPRPRGPEDDPLFIALLNQRSGPTEGSH